MWWKVQSNATKTNVVRLVRDTKQLTFANGGWCMHDEATTHYIGIIDQTSLGHDFLQQTFHYVPTVGWQLDPFGHSSTQASLMTHRMGFDALYFGRIDYQDRNQRRATSECEGLWNTNDNGNANGNGNANVNDNDNANDSTNSNHQNSPNLVSSGYPNEIDESIFWGLTGSYNGQYGPPKGVCLDPNCDQDEYTPFIELNRTEQIRFAKKILLSLRQQSDETRGNHIMVTMGEDFRYQSALVNFANLDALLGTIARLQEEDHDYISSMFGSEYDAINVFYSSPEYYTVCKHNETVQSRIIKQEKHTFETTEPSNSSSMELSKNQQHQHSQTKPINNNNKTPTNNVQWSVKRDDFFPYSDCPHCFWTGYFASRPALKRFERVGSSFLLAIRQIESLHASQDANKMHHKAAATAQLSPNLRALSTHNSKRDDEDEESFFCGQQTMFELEDAIGILQHHDGVSGTSKQHVAYDYAKRLQAGIHAVLPCTIRKLQQILLGNNNHHILDLEYCQLLNETRCDVSVNATKSNMHGTTMDIYAIVYNSLASERSAVVDLPVGANGTFLVTSMGDNDSSRTSDTIVHAQPASFPSNSDKTKNHGSKSWVVSFLATSLPAVGAKVFRIRKQSDIRHTIHEEKTKTGSSNEATSPNLQKVTNGRFSLLVNTDTGDIRRVGSKGVDSLNLWGYYTSFDSTKDDSDPNNGEKAQNSGAYIFRPSTPTQELIIVPAKTSSVVQTSLGTEIHTEYEESWIRTVTKLRTGMPYLEIEYQVGPIPIGDGIGKEVVTRYNTMVDNHGVFYTDSNGRQFVRRKRNSRPTWNLTVFEPTAGNYYPINTAIYVDDEVSTRKPSDNVGRKTPAAFAVVTDRSQGGGSIVDGTIELMVHRRTLADDDRGVGEPINETVSGIDAYPPFGNTTRIGEGLIIRGTHRVLVENNNDDCNEKHKTTTSSQFTESSNIPTCGGIGGARLARSLMDESFAEPLVFVGTVPSLIEIPFLAKSFSGLSKSLPLNVMLITKKPLYNHPEPNAYLVRLGHQYAQGEDPDLSLPAEVDLSHLFPGEQIVEFHETTLSGNRAIEDWRMERLYWNASSQESRRHSSNQYTTTTTTKRSTEESGTIITLTAMDIRTFIVRLED